LFPSLIGDSDELLDKGDVGWSSGLTQKLESRLLRCAVPFDIVASYAGADQILPGIFAAEDFGYHMVYGHGTVILTTILAPVPVPFDDIFAGK